MARVSEVYGGAYLTGADLAGQTHRLAIKQVVKEEVGEGREEKLVIYFAGAKKGLVLNKTNASTLVSAFGDESDSWPGRAVELFTMPVNFNGRTYDGIRVRSGEPPAVAPAATPAPMGVPASQTKRAMAAAVDGDECPF